MEVNQLVSGALFTLQVEGGHTIYSFVKNVYRHKDGGLDYSEIRPIASYWPEGNRGRKIPGHWCYNPEDGTTNCNPYAKATLLPL